MDLLGCYPFVKGILDEDKITLASIDTLNSNQIPFLDDVITKSEYFREGEVLIGGDLNYTVNYNLDRVSSFGNHKAKMRGIAITP